MPFRFKRLDIPDVILVEAKSFPDNSGLFFEKFKESDFNKNGIPSKFVYDNFFQSVRGVLRRSHYQKKHIN